MAQPPTMKAEQYADDYHGNFTSHQISRFLSGFTKFVRHKMIKHVRLPLPLIRVPPELAQPTSTIVHTNHWIHVFV